MVWQPMAPPLAAVSPAPNTDEDNVTLQTRKSLASGTFMSDLGESLKSVTPGAATLVEGRGSHLSHHESSTVLKVMDKVSSMSGNVKYDGSLRGRVSAFVKHRCFGFFIAFVIATNAVVLGIETEHMDDGPLPETWYIIEVVFTTIFAFEFLLRLFAERMTYFHDSWNDFDAFLAVLACIDTFILEYALASEGSTMDLVSIMRVLKLARVVRVVRLFRFFKKLWLLFVGLIDAARALVWAWILVALVLYLFGIFMTRTVGHANRGNAQLTTYFGKVPNSMFTLFQIMTLEEWPVVARLAMEDQPWIWIVIVAFIIITTYSILNVVVAVIVESTLDQAINQNEELAKKRDAELRSASVKIAEVFCATDENSDGVITKTEFLSALEKKDVLLYLHGVGVDVRQAENLFDILDYDDSGSLDAEEFTEGVMKARGQARAKEVLSVQCDLWRYEMGVRKDLQRLCLKVDKQMTQMDGDVDALRQELDLIGRNLPPEELDSGRNRTTTAD